MIKEMYFDIKQLKFVDKVPNFSEIIITETSIKRLLNLIKNIDLDFLNFEIHGDYDLLKIKFDENEFDENDVKELVETRAQMLYWRKRTNDAFEKLDKLKK